MARARSATTTTTPAELIVLLGDHRIGRLTRDARGGRLTFTYDEAWRTVANAYPLSVSMPLAKREHTGDVLEAYLWGLLPDNEIILEAWAKRFQVSARSSFGLLASVGEDCPGAVRFVAPQRLEAIIHGEEKGAVVWLDTGAIAERLRALREDESAWRAVTDVGQFSVGGAQPKTALLFDGKRKRWGIPSGRIPTTHILKPGVSHLKSMAENEHFCLALAAEAGLPVARSQILHFEDEVAIVVERYDRFLQSETGRVARVHQEDCCQALGVLPINKYENVGGPGARAIAALLRERSRNAQEDLDTFVSALAFNWVIAGTDAHAKNYSILIGAGGAIRLAPLYDVASFLPYATHGIRKLTLAMKIGGKYRIHEVGAYAWGKLAQELGRNVDEQRAMIHTLSRTLPDLAATVQRRIKEDGLSHPGLTTLTQKIQDRARACAKVVD